MYYICSLFLSGRGGLSDKLYVIQNLTQERTSEHMFM